MTRAIAAHESYRRATDIVADRPNDPNPSMRLCMCVCALMTRITQ